jgi:quercetin dioxygenase-like cupin family protein
MTIIRAAEAPVFDAAGSTFKAYAAPSRGADQVSLWCVELAPGTTSPLHHMDCEEIFFGLAGRAVATVAGQPHTLEAGDCLILPAGTDFTLHVAEAGEPFRAVACMPNGGQATMVPEGITIAPPWAQ